MLTVTKPIFVIIIIASLFSVSGCGKAIPDCATPESIAASEKVFNSWIQKEVEDSLLVVRVSTNPSWAGLIEHFIRITLGNPGDSTDNREANQQLAMAQPKIVETFKNLIANDKSLKLGLTREAKTLSSKFESPRTISVNKDTGVATCEYTAAPLQGEAKVIFNMHPLFEQEVAGQSPSNEDAKAKAELEALEGSATSVNSTDAVAATRASVQERFDETVSYYLAAFSLKGMAVKYDPIQHTLTDVVSGPFPAFPAQKFDIQFGPEKSVVATRIPDPPSEKK